jgi:hypothetical protein
MTTGRGAGCLVFTAENAMHILHAGYILFQESLEFKVRCKDDHFILYRTPPLGTFRPLC